MLFSDVQRQSRAATYAAATAVALPAVRRLGEHALPGLFQPPRFIPRARTPAGSAGRWARLRAQLRAQLARRVRLATAVAAVAVLIATSVPAWGALQRSADVAPAAAVHSSAGATATAATRVEDLGVATFVGSIPFVKQLRYYGAVTEARPQALRFVEDARRASVAEYVQDIGTQMTLPYLSDAVATKEAIDAWSAAVAQANRQAALAAGRGGWQAAPLPAGTVIPGAVVTFYSCIGNGFCGTMANGAQVFAGAAACSPDLPFGTRFVVASDPGGRVFVCLDRGALAPTWVDVWFYDAADGWAWQSYVGTASDIVILN